MKNVSLQASLNQNKSDIFFIKDEIQSPKFEMREPNSPLLSAYERILFSPQIRRKVDRFKSDVFNTTDIFNTISANDTLTRRSKSFKKVDTSIFFGDTPSEVVKKDKSKPKYDPDPYFSKVSAANLRLKELYGENNIQILKETNDHSRKTSVNFETQEKKFNDMSSSNLNDPKIEAVYPNFNQRKTQEIIKEEAEERETPNDRSKNLVKPVVDFSKGSNKNLSSKINDDTAILSTGKKLKNLESNIKISEKNVQLTKKADQLKNQPNGPKKQEKLLRNDVSASLKETTVYDKPKSKNTVQSSSVKQSQENFSKNVEGSYQEFAIKDIPCVTKANIHEIESIYKKKGVKLFGEPSGEVSFKLRGALNDDKFGKNLEDVHSKLEKELKLKAQLVQTKSGKSNNDDISPSDINWFNPHSYKFGDKIPLEKPPVRKERGSLKTIGAYDTSYKNDYGNSVAFKFRK